MSDENLQDQAQPAAEAPQPSDRPEGEATPAPTTVTEETTTTAVDPGENPSTSAQEVVDEVHDAQAENSGSEEIIEETTTTTTEIIESD